MMDLVRILLSPLVWLASFSAIYGLHGIGCAGHWPEVSLAGVSLFRWVLVAAWVAAILAQVGVMLALRSQRLGARTSFMRWTSLATAWIGLAATVWTLHPVVLISSCATANSS